MLDEETIRRYQERRQALALRRYTEQLQDIIHLIAQRAELPEDVKQEVCEIYESASEDLHDVWRVHRHHDWREDFERHENGGYDFEEHGPFIFRHGWICHELGLDEEKIEDKYLDFLEKYPEHDPLEVGEEYVEASEKYLAGQEEMRQQLNEKHNR